VRLIAILLVVWIVYRNPPRDNWPMWLSALGWVAFSMYWSAAAQKSNAAKSAESTESRRLHLLLTNVGEGLLFIPVPGLQRAFLLVSLPRILAGLALQAGCFALAVWARKHLGGNWSGRIEIKLEHELIRTGPYRFLRHPIYTAVLGMCIGTALVDGHLHALLGVAIVVVAYCRKIPLEETKLREAFGAQYETYRKSTLGLLPDCSSAHLYCGQF
jgi:protein-S-isoprenylcysteine O-methyltransferase Ste14